MFYKMLKENPQQLQEYLKQVVANKINERINHEDTAELQQQSMDVQKQVSFLRKVLTKDLVCKISTAQSYKPNMSSSAPLRRKKHLETLTSLLTF